MPAPPPVLPPDDKSIPDDAIVWRRIAKDHYNPDDRRPSTAAFSDSSDGTPMSATMPPGTLSAEEYVQTWGAHAVAQWTVGQLRALGLGVTRIPTDRDPFHVGVHGAKTGSCRKNLKRLCVWAAEPKHD
jgi:hypothetical protein